VAPASNPTHAILSLLSEICNTLLDPWDPRSRDKEYHDSLQSLEKKMEDIHIQPASVRSNSDPAPVAELYQMATRVYLVRASQHLWQTSANIDSLIDAAFAGPIKSCDSCEHFFPLLILACEARKDEQRTAVLSLIERTGKNARIRSMQGLRNTIHAIWVQQDLYSDSDLLENYVGIMSAVVSSANAVPSFA
jgi:hypothetical protein